MAIKIMLDAGHYGDRANGSPCDTTPKYYESNMNWTLHLYLKEELEKYGIEVGTTRKDKAKDLSVYNRGLLAKGYDMFISLHSNAAGNKVYDGTDRPVVIYPIKDNDISKAFATKVGQVVRSVMNTKQDFQIYFREYPNRPGIDYYGVIRGAVAAGCKMAFIVEHGFHTDTACTKWLLVDENIRKLAVAEAEMIADYYKVSKPADTGSTGYQFVPRYAKPEDGNKYYNRKAEGGYSPCIKGNPTDAGCNVLSNCVGYAVGRFNEIGGYGSCKYLRSVNAENFMQYASGLKIGQEPKVGACMVWQKGATLSGSDGCGHVAIVEKVINSTVIITSESGWGSAIPFTTKTRERGEGNWGMSSSYSFLGFIENPAVPVEYKEPVSPAEVEVGDLVAVNPNAVYWSGKNIPAWVKSRNWYVRCLGYNGDRVRVVIDKSEDGKYAICSPIDAEYLAVVRKMQKEYVPAVGDTVIYNGTVHYTSANSNNAKTCVGGSAKITRIYKLGTSKHPYHLVRTSGSGATVYGWVDVGSFKKS